MRRPRRQREQEQEQREQEQEQQRQRQRRCEGEDQQELGAGAARWQATTPEPAVEWAQASGTCVRETIAPLSPFPTSPLAVARVDRRMRVQMYACVLTLLRPVALPPLSVSPAPNPLIAVPTPCRCAPRERRLPSSGRRSRRIGRQWRCFLVVAGWRAAALKGVMSHLPVSDRPRQTEREVGDPRAVWRILLLWT